MKKLFTLFALTLSCLWLSAQNNVNVNGKFSTSQGDGSPLVHLYAQFEGDTAGAAPWYFDGQETYTDVDGLYEVNFAVPANISHAWIRLYAQDCEGNELSAFGYFNDSVYNYEFNFVYCTVADSTPDTLFDIAGIINGVDSSAISMFRVYLYGASSQNASFIDSVDTYDYYNFTNPPAGEYYIQVMLAPNQENPQNYVPTYYGTEALTWEDATKVNTPSLDYVSHDIKILTGETANGDGDISGNLSTSGSSMSAANQHVMLINTENNQMVALATTNAEGLYQFTNLPEGTYKIWVEIAGLASENHWAKINAGSLSASNRDFVITNNKVERAGTTSIAGNKPTTAGLSVFPNPVANQALLVIEAELSKPLQIKLYNTTGALIWQQELEVSQGINYLNLPVDNLNQGIYTLHVSGNESTQICRFVK